MGRSGSMKSEKLNTVPVTVVVPSFGISAFRSRHAVGFQMLKRRDVYDKIFFVEEGHGVLRIDTTNGEKPGPTIELPLSDATTLLISAGVTHQIVDLRDYPITLSVICIRPGLLDDIPLFQPLWTSFKSFCGQQTAQQLSNPYSIGEFKRIFREIVIELGRDMPLRDAAALTKVCQLLILLVRELSASPHSKSKEDIVNFQASVAYLNDRFTEPLQVDTLADIAGLSYRAFTERFKRTKGMSTVKYWNHLRIELAKRRLLETGDIVGSSQDAGFGDLSHFYKLFKRLVGQTPNEYILQHRK
jgi:AraC-like DNA-binding protein